jgi:hypothetical protein
MPMPTSREGRRLGHLERCGGRRFGRADKSDFGKSLFPNFYGFLWFKGTAKDIDPCGVSYKGCFDLRVLQSFGYSKNNSLAFYFGEKFHSTQTSFLHFLRFSCATKHLQMQNPAILDQTWNSMLILSSYSTFFLFRCMKISESKRPMSRDVGWFAWERAQVKIIWRGYTPRTLTGRNGKALEPGPDVA